MRKNSCVPLRPKADWNPLGGYIRPTTGSGAGSAMVETGMSYFEIGITSGSGARSQDAHGIQPADGAGELSHAC